MALAATLLLVACAPSGGSGATPQPVLDSAATTAALAALGSKPGKDLKPVRLAPGLLPPTNRWFSGLVFGDAPQPVFPEPLSFGLDGGGFAFGVPTVVTNPKTIAGAFRNAVKVGVAGATSWQVSAYDELSVTMSAQGASGTATIAEGSPFVTFASPSGASVTTALAFAKEGDYWTASDGTTTYGLVADKATLSGSTIAVQAGGHLTWFAVPTGGKASDMARLADPLKSTSASYSVADKASTTLHYATLGGGATAFGALPHQAAGLTGATCNLGTFQTVLGTMKVCSGHDLTFTSSVYPAVASLDVSGLSAGDKTALKTQLTLDVATAKAYPADTYFGGKELYRDAELYLIAKQLGAPEAATLKEKVTTSLRTWTSPTGCTTATAFGFGYDSTNKGIVGQTASFGSDEFNDHHFHYGYFLYAAGIMAADDPSLVDGLKPVMNLLAAELASSTPSANFPVRRNFDSYAGHSWASGTSPFADGNNQESSSEAVNAWAGLRLWAKASSNDPLGVEATWMESLEATSARTYYLAFDTTDPVYKGFAHSITPLIFGGKRDYATWFSPEPAALLAVQVLPMSPSSGYLKTDQARVVANLAEATATKGYQQQYGDYLLLYAAYAGETQRLAALEAAKAFPATMIDDGLTKTYVLAFLMTQKA